MIKFDFPPTTLFKELMQAVLYVMMIDGEEVLFRGSNEEWLFDKGCTEIMGGNEKLFEAVKVIKEVYESTDLYDLSEYYSIVLGSIIYSYCFIYNNPGNFPVDPLETRSCFVEGIDFNELSELYDIVDIEDPCWFDDDELYSIIENKKIEKVKTIPRSIDDLEESSDFLWVCGDIDLM